MKILSSKEISTVDAKTIEYKGIQSYELMEMAASTFTDYFIENYYIKECNSVALFCGTGNNGGDGVAVYPPDQLHLVRSTSYHELCH